MGTAAKIPIGVPARMQAQPLPQKFCSCWNWNKIAIAIANEIVMPTGSILGGILWRLPGTI
jgi:hypothetical protein